MRDVALLLVPFYANIRWLDDWSHMKCEVRSFQRTPPDLANPTVSHHVWARRVVPRKLDEGGISYLKHGFKQTSAVIPAVQDVRSAFSRARRLRIQRSDPLQQVYLLLRVLVG